MISNFPNSPTECYKNNVEILAYRKDFRNPLEILIET
jgi:hypothetical protein